jgi:hypothetical protein
LAALDAVRPNDPEEQARRLAALVTTYLQDRLELPAADPSPAEAAAHLRRLGVSAELRKQTAHFYRVCDTVRFAPEPALGRDDLTTMARDLILALEAESWAS